VSQCDRVCTGGDDRIPSGQRHPNQALRYVEIEFFGAAREVTGSCHILRVGGKTVVLDCGMFQGRRADTHAKNTSLPVPTAEIDAVVLSHAHIDHAGRLPYLAREGYGNTIFCTPATHDLCAIMLADSAHIQEQDAKFLARRNRSYVPPLYTQTDAIRAVKQMQTVPYDREFDVVPGVRATFSDAGHILGSASVTLDCSEGARHRRLVFSGDVGRWGLPIIRDPHPPASAEMVIMESTYGNRDHAAVADMPDRLAAIVRETAARGGRVVIPAFAVGRTQELVYDLHRLARASKIPAIPIYIDSPLAIDATTVFSAHPECFDETEDLVTRVRELFNFNLVHYTRDVSESKALNHQTGPMVIIAASGMAESGRILHHLAHSAPDPRSTILIVGFQAEHTLGRRIVERRPLLKVFGDEVPLRARVEILNGYSAHADRGELRKWLTAASASDSRKPPVYLVHGESDAQDALAGQLRVDGYEVEAPAAGRVVKL
jgi:metallo-beta-lactamase family protein